MGVPSASSCSYTELVFHFCMHISPHSDKLVLGSMHLQTHPVAYHSRRSRDVKNQRSRSSVWLPLFVADTCLDYRSPPTESVATLQHLTM